jgi:rod shape-determining protein MreC
MDEETLTSRSSNLTFVFLVAVNILLLTAHLTGYVRTIKNFLYYVLMPFPATSSRIVQTGQNATQNIAEIVRIHQDNQVLRKSLEKYAVMDNEYQRMKEENMRLRQLVNFPAPAGKRSVVASVMTREPGSWFQWVTIDKGLEDGIFVDAPVLAWAADRPVIVGRVGEVYNHTAKVVLVTNIVCALPVEIKTIGEDGLLEGQNSPRLQIKYLLPEGRMAIGDEVVTSPLSTVFPPGITIGQVQDIVVSENEMLRSAVVKPAVNFNHLREVVILIPEKRDN